MAMTEYDHLSILIKDAIPVIKNALDVGGRPMLWGSYGIGKTTIAKQIAKEMHFDSAIVLHPSQDDVLDYKLPYLKMKKIKGDNETIEEQVSAFALSERLPRSGRHMLFIDEINTAPMSLQPTLYSLMLEGTIGNYTLPKECVRIAAGNREHDKCAANPMSAALKDRMFPHLNIRPDSDSWCEWAFKNGIRPEVISFVRDKPDVLDKSDPSDPSGGCTPRSLEFLSLLLSNLDKKSEDVVIQGTIGRGVGTEFSGYLTIFRNKIDIDKLIENPDTYPVPDASKDKAAISLTYGITATLSYKLAALEIGGKNTKESERKFSNILKYLSRINKTYCTICITDAVKTNPKLQGMKPFMDFALKHSNIILDI